VFTNKLKDETVTDRQTLMLLVGSIQELQRFLGKQNVTVRYGVLTAVILVARNLPHHVHGPTNILQYFVLLPLLTYSYPSEAMLFKGTFQDTEPLSRLQLPVVTGQQMISL
jgi:hypothetical protein